MIGMNQEEILFELTKNRLATKYELREKLHFSKEQLDESVNGLKKLRLIRSHVQCPDYRTSIVQITDEGVEYLRRMFNYESS